MLCVSIGGWDIAPLDEILEWEPTSAQWRTLGSMKHARRDHGISIINLEDVNCSKPDGKSHLLPQGRN